MLLSLTPGVIFTQEQFGASGFSGTRGWDVNSSYKFNGARGGNGNNVFTINGAVISDNGSQWDLAPNAESIQEFKAVTTAYDASYGHEAGGAVNFTIKSGTNNWHGDIFEYLRNSVLDANFYQSNFAGQAKGRHEVSQFGGILGGPIRKDKDFLFLSFEGWQEAIPFPGAGTTTIPNDLRTGQNFSKYGIAVYDPLTTHALAAPIASRAMQRIEGIHLLARSVPGQCHPGKPGEPSGDQDSISMFRGRIRPGKEPAGIWPITSSTRITKAATGITSQWPLGPCFRRQRQVLCVCSRSIMASNTAHERLSDRPWWAAATSTTTVPLPDSRSMRRTF